MAIYKLDELLKEHGDDFLILDFNHLFIATTLREEVWLLQQRDDTALIDEVVQRAAAFGIRDAGPDRDMDTYSGGEQAILACLLTMAAIRAKALRGVNLLLYNVLESLSDDNRAALTAQFEYMYSTHHVGVFANDGDRVAKVTVNA